jgi:ketosteroid isomerase-like protein
MATTEELITGFDQGITGDGDAMVATFAPGAEVWHNYDRKVVDAIENMASVGMLARIVRDLSMERIRVEEFPGGFVYQFALHGTVVSNGNPFEMHNVIIASVEGGLVTRIDEYVDPSIGAQLA